jgi:hypothetical protein
MVDEIKRPGWYPDPDGVAGQRWWNGASWSDSSVTPPPAVASAATATPAVPIIYSAENPAPQYPGATPGAPSAAITINAKLNPVAVYSFVAGLVAFFFNFLLVPSAIAIVLGIKGLARAKQLAEAGEVNTVKGLAQIGIVLGVLGAVGGLFQVGLFLWTFVTGIQFS